MTEEERNCRLPHPVVRYQSLADPLVELFFPAMPAVRFLGLLHLPIHRLMRYRTPGPREQRHVEKSSVFERGRTVEDQEA